MKKLLFFSLSLLITVFNAVATVHTIKAGNYYYAPQVLNINQGDTVNWINEGGFHNVNFDINTQTENSFGNPVSFISTATVDSDIYTYIFKVPGNYSYDCSVGSHAERGMVGTINVSTLAGVDGVSQSNSTIDFYPNPADNAINFPNFNQINQVAIFSLKGEKVMESTLIKQQMTLNGLNSGVYYVKVTKNNIVTTTKLVVK